MTLTDRYGLALFGSIVTLGLGVQFYYYMTTIACSMPSFGYGVCVITHPAWPLAVSLFPMALVGFYFMRRIFNQAEVHDESDRVDGT